MPYKIGLITQDIEQMARTLQVTKNWEDTKMAFPEFDPEMLDKGFKDAIYARAGMVPEKPKSKVDPLK
jgi:hypothetical protein